MSNCWSTWKMVIFWDGRGGRGGILINGVITRSPPSCVRVWCRFLTPRAGGSASMVVVLSPFTTTLVVSTLFFELSANLFSCILSSCKSNVDVSFFPKLQSEVQNAFKYSFYTAFSEDLWNNQWYQISRGENSGSYLP